MVGRNDPCPCGSGKKYKKCHGGIQQATSVSDLVRDELFKVRQQFFSEYPNRSQLQEFRQLQQEWQPRLMQSMDETDAQAFVIENFLFSEKPELWQEFIPKQTDLAQRPTTKEVLASWTNVQLFLGQFIGGNEQSGQLRDAFTGDTYTVTDEPPTDMEENQGLIAILLPDPRAGENGRLFLNGYLTIVGDFVQFFEEFNAAVAEAGIQNGAEYLASHYLNTVELAVQFSNRSTKEEKIESELTPEQQAVLDELAKHVATSDFDDETAAKVTGMLSDYLVNEQPAVLKSETLAAGFWRFLQDQEIIAGPQLTQKELSEKFGVSTGTILKRSKEFNAFFGARPTAQQK
ncbi:hypothetical protein B0X71_16070 [Planococcus lenghuensis]|uniref:SEC-C domain-containing protein n=1 Tax=Planococcus lenghuensis TaxID=2213202 RepID=A0A1Q2L3Z6_9BACL|nr:hypothetical protein B0X71_16070 [Planococcus lenghuensis]